MSDPSGRHPIDSGVPSEPKQAVVKTKPCEGCGGVPHGSPTAMIACLHEALIRSKAETLAAKNVVAEVRAAAAKDIETARAETRELRWELSRLKEEGEVEEEP